MVRDRAGWIVAAIVIATGPAIAVDAQAPAADSAKKARRLEVHWPFYIPYFQRRHQPGRTLSARSDSNSVLSVEAGYDGNFRSADLARDESSSITVVVTPMSRLELQADIDYWASEAEPRERATSGRGDTHLRAQWNAFTTERGGLAVALAYIVKLPTANRDALGTGSTDHRLLVPVSFALRGVQVDALGGADANGGPSGPTWSGEGAASITVGILSRVSAHLGFSAQAIDTDQPAGRYLTTGITWQARSLTSIDLGVRAGISPGAPAFGLTAGVTSAIVTRNPR